MDYLPLHSSMEFEEFAKFFLIRTDFGVTGGQFLFAQWILVCCFIVLIEAVNFVHDFMGTFMILLVAVNPHAFKNNKHMK